MNEIIFFLYRTRKNHFVLNLSNEKIFIYVGNLFVYIHFTICDSFVIKSIK